MGEHADPNPGNLNPAPSHRDPSVPDIEAPTCVHHWLLGEPAGGAIPGHCKRCGVDRLFPASPEGAERFDDYRELTQSSQYYETKKSA